MPRYKHTQIGYVTGGAGALATLAVYYALGVENAGELGWIGTAAAGGCALVTVLFSSLTVVVDEEELRFYFGPGFWTRRFPLTNIRGVEVVRNSPLVGWGIRYTGTGWLYNVSGLDAVELDVEGEGSVRIGTDEPERLEAALDEARTPT